MDKSKATVQKSLTELGFFKFVQDRNLQQAIVETFRDYKDDGEIQFSWDFLNRVFSIDAKSAYTFGGIKSQIKILKPLFKARGLPLRIGRYVEQLDRWQEFYVKRAIQINGKMYDATTGTGSEWEWAFNCSVNLIDEILENLGQPEEVFLLQEDEASTMILLDKPLFFYLVELIPPNAANVPKQLSKSKFLFGKKYKDKSGYIFGVF